MVRTVLLAAAAAAAATAAGAALAQPRHKPVPAPQYVWCTGKPVTYDPFDLNQMRASVSASSRLALAIREREFLASCHPAPHPRHHTG